jgi:short-subunit dehydrogenase
MWNQRYRHGKTEPQRTALVTGGSRGIGKAISCAGSKENTNGSRIEQRVETVKNCASSLFQVGKYEGKFALSCPATQ